MGFENDIIENLYGLVDIIEKYKNQKYEIEMLKLKGALYKAYFMGSSELVEKLKKRIEENEDSFIGEYDGFSYSSKRACAKFKSLKDMFIAGELTEKEFDFCKI